MGPEEEPEGSLKKSLKGNLKEEAEGEPEEEKCDGPWKVVKDPSESGSRGENYE